MNFVFDFGGVLFNWQPAQLLQSALPHIAPDAERAAHWAAQIFQSYGGDWADFDRGTVSADDLVLRIAHRTGLNAADVQHLVDTVPAALQPLPDSVALLQRLHASGRRLYYLSNMPAPMAGHLERSHDFMRCFSAGVFSSHVHHNKPEPAIYEIAAQRFGHPAQDLVFLDDHLPNVVAARALGWNALHFRNAAQAEAEMATVGWL
jgi:putative hydrolase of the HAD superfamily